MCAFSVLCDYSFRALTDQTNNKSHKLLQENKLCYLLWDTVNLNEEKAHGGSFFKWKKLETEQKMTDYLLLQKLEARTKTIHKIYKDFLISLKLLLLQWSEVNCVFVTLWIPLLLLHMLMKNNQHFGMRPDCHAVISERQKAQLVFLYPSQLSERVFLFMSKSQNHAIFLHGTKLLFIILLCCSYKTKNSSNQESFLMAKLRKRSVKGRKILGSFQLFSVLNDTLSCITATTRRKGSKEWACTKTIHLSEETLGFSS